MKTISKRGRCLFLVGFLVLSATSASKAQDPLYVTNLNQLVSEAFSGEHAFYIPFLPLPWQAFSIDGGEPWWIDCSYIADCPDLLATPTNLNSGVTAYAVVLTVNLSTGQATIQAGGSTNVVANVAAPAGYQPGDFNESAYHWWQGLTNCPDCFGIEGTVPPPSVTLNSLLANYNDYATYVAYESNLEANAAAAADGGSGGFSPMFGGWGMDFGDDYGSDPCLITNYSAPFNVTSITPDGSGDIILTWPSCTNGVYVVQSEPSLTPTSSWTDVAWMFGTDQSTTWTDTNAVGLTQNFYQIALLSPNYLNFGVPAWWALQYGFDPLDPNLALEDPTGDGFTLLEDYVNGTDPFTTNTTPVFIINNGNPYTSTLSIPVQATSTNYPRIRVWLDTLSTNVTVFTNTGATVTYTLPDEGDGVYGVYAQYANTNGAAASQVYGQSVTLSRGLPVISITSPASNAVLNQAFISLAAMVYDPLGSPNITGPLSIWINGQRYWERAGTNLFVEHYPVPAGTNSLTVAILAVNSAGLTNSASRTWTVNTSTATNAPNMLSVNLSSEMLLPNVNSIWVEGTIDNDYALVKAIVYAASGDVLTNSLTVGQYQYKGLVPLEGGTNQLVLLASDAAGNTSSNVFTLISANDFSAAITNPVFGAFANVPSNYVSGYVSALYDAGLPTQANVTNVTINGVAAVLGTNVDAYGNISFTTTNMIPLGVPITGTIAGPGIPTDPPSLTPMMSQAYEITAKEIVSDGISSGEELAPFNLTWSAVSNCWQGDADRQLETIDYIVTNGSAQAQGTNLFIEPSPLCQTLLNPDQISWQGSTNAFTETLSGPIGGSLSFGVDGYEHGPGQQFAVVIATYDPTNNTCTYNNETDALRTMLRQKNAGWITFQPELQIPTNTTEVLTFQGVNYAAPNNVAVDLSQVQFRGQSPVSNDSESVSYLMTVSPNQQYTINQDDFTWPSFSPATNYATMYNDTYDTCPILKSYSWAGNFLTDLHWLSWTGFTNHSPVHILWTNGVDITGTSGNSIIVGQQVNLTATVDTPGIATSNFAWSVSVSAISNFVVASDSSSGGALPLTQTNNASVGFYWVSGGQQNVTCSVLLNNGSVATSSASFTVHRPNSIMTVVSTGTIGCDSTIFIGGSPASGQYLHFGDGDGNPGVLFTNTPDQNIQGVYQWVQIATNAVRTERRNNGQLRTYTGSGLDFAYPLPTSRVNSIADSPALGSADGTGPLDTNYTAATVQDNYNMWLMFNPNQSATSMSPGWVPLKMAQWGWNAAASRTGSVWSLTSGSQVPATPSIGDTTNFPSWSQIAQDAVWSP